jgi:hypothetical protein
MGNDTQSFIVRVWSERESPKNECLAFRGSIDHVGTGKRLYFHRLESIVLFIEAQVDTGPRPPRTRWQNWIAKFRSLRD